jgi:hypothetical protein
MWLRSVSGMREWRERSGVGLSPPAPWRGAKKLVVVHGGGREDSGMAAVPLT